MMLSLLLAIPAFSGPWQDQVDLSFQKTALMPRTCSAGQSHTWDVTSKTVGRSHGSHVNTGESIDRDIAQSWTRTYTLTCTDPTHLQLRMTLDGETTAFVLLLNTNAEGGFNVVSVTADTPRAREAAKTWRPPTDVSQMLSWLFPPMTQTAPSKGDTWDASWNIGLTPWWDCHGRVTAGALSGRVRDYTLDGRCEQISYHGRSSIVGTFTREDNGFGVVDASWKLSSLWEHYYIFTDTEQTVTVKRRQK